MQGTKTQKLFVWQAFKNRHRTGTDLLYIFSVNYDFLLTSISLNKVPLPPGGATLVRRGEGGGGPN
jgi:hypothetical protein